MNHSCKLLFQSEREEMNSNISVKPEPNDVSDEPPPLESKRLSAGDNINGSRGTNFYDSMHGLNFDGMLQTMGGLMNDMKVMKTQLVPVFNSSRKEVMEKSRKIEQLEIALEKAKRSLTNSKKEKERTNQLISVAEQEKNKAQSLLVKMVAENQKQKEEKRKLEESTKAENSKNAKCLQETVALCLQQAQTVENLTKENSLLSVENKKLKAEIERAKKEIAAKIERDNQSLKTVLEEYTKMANQNQNLTLEKNALMEKQNSMRSIAEQSRLLMETISLPALEENTNTSLSLELPPSESIGVPAKKRKSNTSKVKKDSIQNIASNSSTSKLPNVPNKPKSAKKSKKRPRSDSNQNKQMGSSSAYWNNISTAGSSESPLEQNEKKLKTNEAFEQKKIFRKWNEAGKTD